MLPPTDSNSGRLVENVMALASRHSNSRTGFQASLAVGLASLLFGFPVIATTAIVPDNDSVVIATLRKGRMPAAERELRTRRQTLAADPTNLPLALEVARRGIERGRQEADPRFLGQAEMALAPWVDPFTVPAEVLVLRATIHQSLHDFEKALAELDTALVRDPRNVQAWLTKATIHTVRAEFPEARRAAARLLGKVDLLTATAAISQIASLTGMASLASAQLEAALQTKSGDRLALDPLVAPETPQRLWAQTMLAETLARLGRRAEAETHFRHARELSPDDPYLLGAFADFLLDQGRPTEVAELLQNYRRIDGLLLRWAEAAAKPALGEEPRSTVTELAGRFAAARARGDRVHLREEARFELRLRGDPATALRLARENWKIQKEPADARLFLEAAQAAGDPVAETEIMTWIAAIKLEDVAFLQRPRTNEE